MSSKLQLSVLDIKSVSKSYCTALSMIHDLTSKMYEDIHDEKGNPILDEDYLYLKTQEYKKIVRGELDMIKSTASQYNEG